MTRDVIVMVAPNGARKTKRDHATLPVSIEDTVSEAALCHAAGASALHAHVRGSNDEHVLDAGLYRELIAEMAVRVPGMLIQVTSEAVGIYTPEQQIACIQAVVPQMASISLREISSSFEKPDYAQQYFAWCDEHEVHIQHIVYSADELQQFLDYRQCGVIPAGHRCVLFVLGRYNVNFQSDPTDLDSFLQYDLSQLDWFTCAFGHKEQQCVMRAIEAGGNARIGFENNLYLPNGNIASNTASLVESLVAALRQNDFAAATSEAARQRLGIRSA
ncbi:MAG: 3-keto-5-aminohexanoate cleavage protein [Gammaproteobacteria bacterium]|nr:3-keto-5-aminohexanoate cleavage protein [Gammaproteobacteria bacterium]